MNTPVVARGKNEPYMTTVRDQKLVCRKMSQKPKIVSWGLTLKKSLENSSGSGVLMLSFPADYSAPLELISGREKYTARRLR